MCAGCAASERSALASVETHVLSCKRSRACIPSPVARLSRWSDRVFMSGLRPRGERPHRVSVPLGSQSVRGGRSRFVEPSGGAYGA